MSFMLGLTSFCDVLHQLPDLLLLGWIVGSPLHVPTAIPDATLLDGAAFFKPGEFLEQEFISLELGFPPEVPCQCTFLPSATCETLVFGYLPHVQRCMLTKRKRGTGRRSWNPDQLIAESRCCPSSLTTATGEDDQDLGDAAVPSRLVFTLGPRYMLRLQGALIGLPPTVGCHASAA